MNTKRHFFASPKETPQMGKKDVLNALASKILDQKPASSDTLKNPFENNILNIPEYVMLDAIDIV